MGNTLETNEIDRGPLVKRDSKGRLLPGSELASYKNPETAAKLQQAKLLYHFRKTFDTKAGEKHLAKMLETKPERFFDLWSRLIVQSLPKDQTPVTPEQGQGLLAALQTGRLAEQLSALVRAGQRAMEVDSPDTQQPEEDPPIVTPVTVTPTDPKTPAGPNTPINTPNGASGVTEPDGDK